MKPLKICKKCGVGKTITEFAIRKGKGRRHDHCKTCRAEAVQERIRKMGRGNYNEDMKTSKMKNCDRISNRYYILKHNAKKRGIEVKITQEQHDILIEDRACYYCDADFSKQQGAGLNRVDNSKGYIMGNLKPCCGTCNSIMNNFGKEELISRLYKIANRLKKEGVKK